MILLVQGDDAAPEDLLQGHLIGLQGGVEVDQGFLQIQQLDELLVPLGLVELALHEVVDFVDLFQVLEEALGYLEEHIEDEAGALLGLGVAHQAVLKVPEDAGLLQADGDDVLLGDDDAQGQGGVLHRVVLLHGGHIDDDEGLPVLGVDAGGLLLVQGGPQEGGLHPQGHRHGVQLILAGIGQVDPAAVLNGIQAGHLSVDGLVDREQLYHAFLGAGGPNGHKNPRTLCLCRPRRDFPGRPNGDTGVRVHRGIRSSEGPMRRAGYGTFSTHRVTAHGAYHSFCFSV